MSEQQNGEVAPLVADDSRKDESVIDLLRAACWERPTGDTKQPVKRLTKE